MRFFYFHDIKNTLENNQSATVGNRISEKLVECVNIPSFKVLVESVTNACFDFSSFAGVIKDNGAKDTCNVRPS